MQPRLFPILPSFVLLLIAWRLHRVCDPVDRIDSAGLRASEALNLFVPSVGSTGTNYRTAASRTVRGLKAAAGSTNAESSNLAHKHRDNPVRKKKRKPKGAASERAAKKTVRYWTRPATSWTPPDLSAFPQNGVIPHKWRPRYNPTQYHLNSLMVVQFEWDRMGERWGYAPLGPWCGLCQTLKKGCRKECQDICGEHCEGLGVKRFTDQIGCLFCEKDDGYGCRKYAECRANCGDCRTYTPLVNQTRTTFAWGPLRRDLFGKEAALFPDKEANEPWTNWGNPLVYDRTPTEVEPL